MPRDINITASCAHCGEVLDTNEAAWPDIMPDGIIEDTELHCGHDHECFQRVCSECGEFEGHGAECSQADGQTDEEEED